MRWLAAAMVGLFGPGMVQAQYPYGYQIGNGRIGPGYAAGYGMSPRGYGYGSGTVTDYQSLMNVITQIPGWYGTGPTHRPHTPRRPKPTVPRSSILADDGKILWPSATPDYPARKEVDDAVHAAVRDEKAYGHAPVRKVVEARTKLSEFARRAVPNLKAQNPTDGLSLEHFVFELQETLATLAEHY
jgi:hypothetical protein